MSYKNILKILAVIGISVSIIFLLDVIVGVIYDENYQLFLLYDFAFFIINLLILLSLKNHTLNLKTKDSILVVNLVWLLLGLVGATPLMLYTNISFASAFFEAISGFTTTGATVYTDIEALTHIVLFHRSLMHWLGGLGVIVLGVGILSMINPTGSLSLFKAESTGIELEKMTPKIKDTAIRLWVVYIGLTFLDMIFLKFFGMNWFDAINHSFSTISTGGFSTKNNSIGYFKNDGILWTTTIFMILAGINFLAHLKLLHRDFTGYNTSEVKYYLTIGLILSLILTTVHINLSDSNFYDAFKYSAFSMASIITTTGFTVIDYSLWSHLAIAVIFIGMLIGGNVGSTAGGFKVIRHVIIIKTLFAEFKRTLHPDMIVSVFVDDIKQNARIISATFGFLALYLSTIGAMSVYVYASGYDAITSISSAFAVVGNIGPGFGLVGPSHNFSFFSDVDKIVLSIGMVIGRLECYTVYILLSGAFWRKF